MEGGSFVNDATGPYAGVITGFTHHATFVNRESETAPEDPALSFLSAVELQAFKRFVKHFVATKEIRRDDAIALDFLFGAVFQHSLELIEEESIVIRQNASRTRTVIEVYGNTGGDSYWIPLGHALCQCMYFMSGKKLFCKHILAGHLYLAITPKEQYKFIDDEKLNEVCKECFED